MFFLWEAPWSSGERQGLTIRAMVLGRGFESWLHLKTRWRWTTRWQKNTKINKDSQMGQVTSKKKKFLMFFVVVHIVFDGIG